MLKYKNIIEDSIIEHLSVTDKEEIPVIICGKDCLCDDLEKHVLEMGKGKIYTPFDKCGCRLHTHRRCQKYGNEGYN